jgi:Flp pilus assembly pilin Flp
MPQIQFLDRDEQGQGLAEYALILGLIAVIAIAALLFIGTSISGMLSVLGGTL